MKKNLTLLLQFILPVFIFAQDANFSQNQQSTFMRHPASISQIHCGELLSASYRSQWFNLPDANRTISVGYAKKMKTFALGGSILHNDAGMASLKTSRVAFNLSYQKVLNAQKDQVAIGMSGGLLQQRFDAELLHFDNQYVEGKGFDTQLGSREDLSTSTELTPSYAVGLLLVKHFREIKFSTGLSVSNFHTPQIKFTDYQKEHYPTRMSAYGNVLIPVSDLIKLEAYGAWSQQSMAAETIVGAKVHFDMSSHKGVRFGVANRINDAFIFEIGTTIQHTNIALSYDMNYSGLHVATQSRGAIELSASFCFSDKKINKPKPLGRPNRNVHPLEVSEEGKANLNKELEDYNPIVTPTEKSISSADLKFDESLPTRQASLKREFKENDSDYDGIIDSEDRCPFIKGAKEMQGCPDSDEDGLSDVQDYCPFIKGDQDNNGCPKMSKADHQRFMGEESIRALVEFDTDKAIIRTSFKVQLEQAIDFLLANPEAKAFISGHTDNEGNARYNFQLGEQRAHAVMGFFLAAGVSYQQLSIISFGETKPLETNGNDWSKAKNRRVEVMVVK